jgi:OPA family glycerol-3-phosphate transporter-like MFS transporter
MTGELPSVENARRLVRWRILTITLMATGYAAYYLCRSDFSVVMPLLIGDLGGKGVSPDAARVQLGTIASLGVLAYSIGKFPTGWLADFFGGRTNFLAGMAGSIVFTVLFAMGGGIPFFTLAWICNRGVQALGWNGMVKISSRWFSYSSYGTAMGILALSYLFGDAASRAFMSVLLGAGLGWRGVFYTAAATLGVLMAINLVWLRESPRRIGCPEPPANPDNLFHAEAEVHEPQSLGSLLRTFAKSRAFWLVCLLSCGLTILRETFNLWTPTYFTQAVGLSVADSAGKSALFPLFGGISVLLGGVLSDRLGKAGRALIIFCGLLVTAGVLSVMALGEFGGSKMAPVALVALVALAMMAPYSYLSGAISLDFGGKQGSASASGIIDGTGYLGGVLAGNSVAQVSVMWGWKGVFGVLAGVSLLSAVAAGVYLRDRWRS